jgi:hypothetical protein
MFKEIVIPVKRPLCLKDNGNLLFVQLTSFIVLIQIIAIFIALKYTKE